MKYLREDKGKVARGGASNRKFPSLAAQYIHYQGLDRGRVLDFGCGYGIDANTYNWESYDPFYNDIELKGKFDTIICINVISAVSEKYQEQIIDNIRCLLDDNGSAYISVPRNIPIQGKYSGYHRRPQRYVMLKEKSVYSNNKYEIYKLNTT